MAWDDERERYQLRMPTLQSERFETVEGEPAELVRLINREQLMRVVVRGCDTIYAHGSFYRPIIPATRTDSFQLLDILYDVDELVSAKSEKGTAIVNDDWHPESVFGLISALAPAGARTAPAKMAAIVTSPEMILCTDLGIEAADFVITEAHRIALVHAKASTKTHHCSASALHDVASQAIKNLQYLQPLAVAPMDRSRWMRKWSAKPHVTGTTYRLRHGGFSSLTKCGSTSEPGSKPQTPTGKCGWLSEMRCPSGTLRGKRGKRNRRLRRFRSFRCCRPPGQRFLNWVHG